MESFRLNLVNANERRSLCISIETNINKELGHIRRKYNNLNKNHSNKQKIRTHNRPRKGEKIIIITFKQDKMSVRKLPKLQSCNLH